MNEREGHLSSKPKPWSPFASDTTALNHVQCEKRVDGKNYASYDPNPAEKTQLAHALVEKLHLRHAVVNGVDEFSV